MDRRAEIRERALKEMQHSGVLMMDGHFDYGNGFHGRVYLNPHRLFRQPSTIWRVAQDLLDVVPADILQSVELVAGPATGGALLAHTVAGLLDSWRSLSYEPCLFAPFHHSDGGFTIRDFYRDEIKGKRVLLADDVRNTGETFERCATLIDACGGTLLATVEIYDRMETASGLEAPNFSLADFRGPENYRAADCPFCKAGEAVTRF